MEQLCHECDVVRLSYNSKAKMGKAVWRGFLSSDELRENALRSVALINEQGLTRWLADQRTMRAIRQQDLQWIVTNLVPQLLKSPLRRMAVIVSGDIFNNMAMEQLFKRSGSLGDLVIQEFDSEEVAMEWLMRTPATEKQVNDSVQSEQRW